jgi:hypothetical protein
MLGLAIIGIYLQARVGLAYPATAMDESEAPVRQSWTLSRGQSWRLAAGNLAVMVPIAVGIAALFYVLSLILEQVVPINHTTVVGAMREMPLFIQVGLKSVGVFCILIFISVLSAYHAHAYAYLVRSSSSISSS